MRRPTIADVAARSDVSPSTVSLVLNSHPSIPPATAERVRTAARALGYVYNRRAASLRRRRAFVVALVATEIGNAYFGGLLAGLRDGLAVVGMIPLVAYTGSDVEEERRVLRTLVELGVDGIVLLPTAASDPSELSRWIAAAGVPFITVARTSDVDVTSVHTDNVEAGRLLGAHLRAVGLTRVGFVGGDQAHTTTADRVRGVSEALGLDLMFSPAPVTAAGGAAAAGRLLDDQPDLQAVVAMSDLVATGVYAALRRRGLEPGRDVAVAGFDDLPEARHQSPALTTVATFSELIGRACADLLVERLARTDAHPAVDIVIAPHLEIRESTSRWAGSGDQDALSSTS